MNDRARVELDTRELAAGARQLLDGVDRGIGPVAGRTAEQVAGRLRPLVPRRTGRLRNTVKAEQSGDSALVRYGSGVPYAGYIDGRTGATTQALENAPRTFYGACHQLAAREVGRL